MRAKALITAGVEASLYPGVVKPLINYGLDIARRVLQHAPETSNDLAIFISYGETAVSEMSRRPAQSQREPAMLAYSTTPFGVAVDFSPERIGPSGWLSTSGVDDVIKVSKSSDGGESAMSYLAGALIDIGRGLLSSSSADIAEEMIEFGVMQCNPATAPDVLASKVFFGLLDLSAKLTKDERLSEVLHYRGMHESADEAVKLTQELLARGESPNTLSLSGQALTMKVMALRWLAMSGEEEINEDSLRLCQTALRTLERVRSADPAVWNMDCLESFLGYAINARDDKRTFEGRGD